MALSGQNVEAASRPPRRRLADAVRMLAVDAVQAANSGHPGMPMGMADIAEVLWNDFLRFSPRDPDWHNRDRFVLSNGHGSMLLYAIAHLAGYDLGIDELRHFRQFGARTAGHPEREIDIGIETTTGPLGQGMANAVGFAIAEKMLAAQFNRPGLEIVDHRTFAFLGDGCMMEGVSHEACSLAGTLGLGKLIALYDDNGISIDGDTQGWFTDDTPARFRAYGWHVVEAVDGHDSRAIANALREATDNDQQPSLICCKTVIGFGAPNVEGSAATHGAALGEDEVAATRKNLGWEHAPFEIPDDIKQAWDASARGAALVDEWRGRYEEYARRHPELAAVYARRMSSQLPVDWDDFCRGAVSRIDAEGKNAATRQSSQRALEAFAPRLPELVGGSADLTGSNNTYHGESRIVNGADASGNYLNYGVREFAMAAIMNGISLHGGFIPYAGTFLVFSDYARNAMRMAALMRIQSIYVLTHDSIGLGEDGPTHQPVEHVASLRAIPNMTLWRPCDGVETVISWRAAIERRDGPTSLVLSRQSLPHIERTDEQIRMIERGGYVLRNSAGEPDFVLIATGSEVALALAAAQRLETDGHSVRVVSMPCTQLFDSQSADYRQHVLPPGTKRLAIEAGVGDGWWRYLGCHGDVIGMASFGQSAPAKDLFEHYGFTVDAIVEAALGLS